MRQWLILCGFAAASACGPGVSGSGTNDTTNATEDATGSSGSSETTGSALECEQFSDEQSDSPDVMIEIRNVGDVPILLNDPCSSREYVELTTESEWTWPGDFCRLTCEGEFVDGCIDCGACASAAYTVLPPGQTLEFAWAGVLYERVTPPEGCFEGGSCAPSCQQTRAPVDEPVTVIVEAITQADCYDSEPVPELACDCEPGPEGWCEAYGDALIDPTLQAVTEHAAGSPGPIVIELAG